MDRRLWGVVAVVAGLFAAAWVYMELQKKHWELTRDRIQSQIDQVDSLTQPIGPGTSPQQARERSQSLPQRMRELTGEQARRTDSVQRIIREQNLLGDEPPSRK